MHTAVWHWMWQIHEQAKDLIRFFVNPNESAMGQGGQGNVSGGGNNIGPPSYKKTHLFGVFLGPFLFFLALLFFRPVGVTPEGIAILASPIWIASWWITEA